MQEYLQLLFVYYWNVFGIVYLGAMVASLNFDVIFGCVRGTVYLGVMVASLNFDVIFGVVLCSDGFVQIAQKRLNKAELL